jgi:SAM-dependent methyltransferase
VSEPWLQPALTALGNARCRTWDLLHGVDTCGDIPLATLDFQSENKTPGLEYQSHHPAIIRAAIGSLPIHYQDYTFVDLGCGKGRVLLVASAFPFRRIVGLEFAPSLAETARRNLKSFRSLSQRCSEIEVITTDASEYELQPEPQVLYFYSPFERTLMEQIACRIEDSFQRRPRDLLVLFSGVLSMRDAAFGCLPTYERLQRRRYVDLYRHRPS